MAAAPGPPAPSTARRALRAGLGIAAAAGIGLGLGTDTLSPPPAAMILPRSAITPGAIDAQVHYPEICAKTWQPGADGGPPVPGGMETYSQAGRQTSAALKQRVFDDYRIINPHDGGASYEVDHLVPLALGGRDVEANLWPQSRLPTVSLNAYAKDRLESRLYHLLCHPDPGEPHVDLAQVQQALRSNWRQAFETYCDDDGCQASDSATD